MASLSASAPDAMSRLNVELRGMYKVGWGRHPGYGVSVCQKDNAVFITPTPDGMAYENSIVELRDVRGKGKGVFAKRDLDEEDMVVYYGRQHPSVTDYEEGNYVTELNLEKSSPKGVKLFVDGNPSLESKYAIKLMFASKVNEPSESERVNCLFEDSENGLDQKSLPPLFATFAYIRPKGLIRAGSELLICYGGSYPRDYTTSCKNREPAGIADMQPPKVIEQDANISSAFIARIYEVISKPSSLVTREAMSLQDFLTSLTKSIAQYYGKRTPESKKMGDELTRLMEAVKKKEAAHNAKVDVKVRAALEAESQHLWNNVAQLAQSNDTVRRKMRDAEMVFLK
jgi:hypothetical protein